MADPRGLALVTGAPGWLGTRLVRHLANGHPDYPADASPAPWQRVRCLVQPGAPLERLTELAPGAELVEGDIRDPETLERLCAGAEGATLFHLAAVIHPRRLRELWEVNVEGTRNVLDAAAAAGVKRVVGTSSNSPVGGSRDPDRVYDEDSPYRPSMGYARSKRRMEELLNEAHAAGRIETVVVRPGWFYGPDQPARQTTFFRMIRAGRAPLVGGGRARRAMSYVDNTALGVLLAGAVPQAAGRTYWVADARAYSMSEIVDTVEDLLDRDFGMHVARKRVKLPTIASHLALALDGALQAAGLYEPKLHVLGDLSMTTACSVERARRELGYRPVVGLREGMRRSIEWCLASGQRI